MTEFRFSFFCDDSDDGQSALPPPPSSEGPTGLHAVTHSAVPPPPSSEGPTGLNAVTRSADTGCHLIEVSAPPFIERSYHSIKVGKEEIVLLRCSGENEPLNSYDLIPGVYEGGRKIWEGSLDLAHYLNQHRQLLPPDRKAKILELGCGHGIPGLLMLVLGYCDVCFSDFNEDVLRDFTWPNIQANCKDPQVTISCLGGDWMQLSRHLQERQRQFELILTAETLYSQSTTRQVFQFLCLHLTVGGQAFVATKRFYFGVGGGTTELLSLLSQQSHSFAYEIVWSLEDGRSNIRDIIRITKVEGAANGTE